MISDQAAACKDPVAERTASRSVPTQKRPEAETRSPCGSGGNPKAPTSHAEALKSTSIMGGSTAIVMLIRMVRTKVLAVLLGPAGVGLEAVYDSVLSLARTAVGLGIDNSGVRQIAAAVGTGDKRVIAGTVITLRRVCRILGVLGAAVLFLARERISQIAFGHSGQAFNIGLLALIPLLGSLAGGQGALLQGTRRIADLAKLSIFGALATAAFSIPMVWIWGLPAIPAYLILTSAGTLFVSWLYVRKIPLEPMQVPVRQTLREARQLLQLGLVFLATGLMTTGVLFFLRILVTRQEGVDGAGQFQAASALSMVYVGFVLQAMGTDFYPRLTAVESNDVRCNQLVNEQAEISILLALPGVLATIAFAPWVIHLFYSEKFRLAGEILCWQVAGMLFRVNSWPMGYIILAKGRGALMFWTDLMAYSFYAFLGWLGLKFIGLPGVGMAFLGLYIFHSGMIYLVVRRLSGFRWSPANLKFAVIGVITVAITLTSRLTLKEPWGTLTGFALASGTGCYCLFTLCGLIGPEKMNYYFKRVRLPFRMHEPDRHPDQDGSIER